MVLQPGPGFHNIRNERTERMTQKREKRTYDLLLCLKIKINLWVNISLLSSQL